MLCTDEEAELSRRRNLFKAHRYEVEHSIATKNGLQPNPSSKVIWESEAYRDRKLVVHGNCTPNVSISMALLKNAGVDEQLMQRVKELQQLRKEPYCSLRFEAKPQTYQLKRKYDEGPTACADEAPQMSSAPLMREVGHPSLDVYASPTVHSSGTPLRHFQQEDEDAVERDQEQEGCDELEPTVL